LESQFSRLPVQQRRPEGVKTTKMKWKPDIDGKGNCRNNPCDSCSGEIKGEDGKTYNCDNCPII